MNTPSENKQIVARFNREVIEQGNMQAFNELVASDFVNHTAPPGTPQGPGGFAAFFTETLRPALPDLTVELHDQIAEGDKVVTRKTISGTHKGVFLGVSPTGRRITIRVTDIVRIKNGQYAEHWGNADLHGAIAQMK
jgi:predicted ester cyclase